MDYMRELRDFINEPQPAAPKNAATSAASSAPCSATHAGADPLRHPSDNCDAAQAHNVDSLQLAADLVLGEEIETLAWTVRS